MKKVRQEGRPGTGRPFLLLALPSSIFTPACKFVNYLCKTLLAANGVYFYNASRPNFSSMRSFMRIAHRSCVAMLCVALTTYASADGNSWGRIRYNGGTLQTKVDPKDWDNHLTITSDTITLVLKDKQQVVIPAKSVTGLSYGQEAHRRVGTMIALGILISPLALFGLMHKTRLHFIGIEYKTEDGKNAGLLLQGDKENYRAILTALEGATGAPLSVSEKDREFVPGMPNTTVVSEKDQGKGKVPTTESASADETGTVSVKSTPESA